MRFPGLNELVIRIDNFNGQRNWQKFHTPSNLAKSIVIEASELLEHFQWSDEVSNQEEVEEEVADVMIYCLQLCLALGVDPIEIMNSKMDKNEAKYPVELAFGNAQKYTEYKKNL